MTTFQKAFTQEMARKLKSISLGSGSHSAPRQRPDNRNRNGLCVMEALAYITGQEHSDHPICVAPSLRNYMIALNDSAMAPNDTKNRNKLKRVIPTVMNTRPIERVKGMVWNKDAEEEVKGIIEQPKTPTKAFIAFEQQRCEYIINAIKNLPGYKGKPSVWGGPVVHPTIDWADEYIGKRTFRMPYVASLDVIGVDDDGKYPFKVDDLLKIAVGAAKLKPRKTASKTKAKAKTKVA